MIKAEHAAKVKGLILLFALCSVALTFPERAYSQSNSDQEPSLDGPAEPPPPAPPLDERDSAPDSSGAPKEKLEGLEKSPDKAPEKEPEKEVVRTEAQGIDAEEFRSQALKKSSSGRVVLFDDFSGHTPKPGKILLLRQGKDDVAAVRVLKTYPSKFAAKVVLPFKEVQVGQDYRTLKKIGDKMIQLIEEREKRLAEEDNLNPPPGGKSDTSKTDAELAKEVAPDDVELDRGIPPKAEPKLEENKKKKPAPLFGKDGEELSEDSVEVQDEDDPYSDVTTKEVSSLDPYRIIFSAEFAILESYDSSNSATTYTAFGGRVGVKVFDKLLLRKASLQDSFVIEGGVFYSSVNSYKVATDSLTIIPVELTGRYNFNIGDNLTLFAYGGVLKNFVLISGGNGDASYANPAFLGVAAGGGLMLRLGPSWAIRGEGGIDMIALGAVLRF